MVGWTFENALVAIQSPRSIPFSVLLSMDGLCLGDICFAKIQTTLHMQTVSITVLERWIADGSFNPECMAEGNYSHSTAILILLNPNKQEHSAEERKHRTYRSTAHGTSGADQ